MEEVAGAVSRHEGCNLYGWVQVQKIAGNIHFAVRPEAMMAVAENPAVLDALMQRHVEVHHDPVSEITFYLEFGVIVGIGF